MKRLVTLGLISLLAACSGAPAVPASTSAPTSAASAAPTPTVAAATEKELASVIAGFDHDARDALDEAEACRIAFIQGDGADPLVGAKRVACLFNDMALGSQTRTAANELDALKPPTSMEPLVAETLTVLRPASGDLDAACGGVASAETKITSECSAAVMERYSTYGELDSVLAKWKPYM